MLYPILTHGVRAACVASALCGGVAFSQPMLATVSPSPTVNEAKVETLKYELTPERRALLATIRYAEGTWANGDPVGYRIMFGGGTFNDLSRHPDRVIYGRRYASAAAGAYQFMPFTWAYARSALKLNSFGPQEQDQAALWLVERRGALAEIDRGRFSPEAVNRLSPEWASFPTLWGRSYYGQPVKDYRDLHRFFHQRLQEYQQPVQPQLATEEEPQPKRGPLFHYYFSLEVSKPPIRLA
jgi:muramidase (phage lysozyme)